MNIRLYNAPDAAHYYNVLGPVWEIPRADGKGTRAPDRRDARKGLVAPSVTGILRLLAKPELEQWKLTGAVMSALTLPRLEGEAEDAFASRVVEDSRQESARAAEYGSEVHRQIAALLRGQFETEPLMPETDAFLKWWEGCKAYGTLCAVEHPFYCAEDENRPYGGTIDFACSRRSPLGNWIDFYLFDIKTRKTTPGKPVGAYLSDGLQLAAYAYGWKESYNCTDGICNVVLSTTEPGRVDLVDWSKHIVDLDELFQNLLTHWWMEPTLKPNVDTVREPKKEIKP